MSQTVQRVADEETLAHLCIEKRTHGQLVAAGENAPPELIPDNEKKIAVQVIETVVAPGGIRVKYEFGAGNAREITSGTCEFCD